MNLLLLYVHIFLKSLYGSSITQNYNSWKNYIVLIMLYPEYSCQTHHPRIPNWKKVTYVQITIKLMVSTQYKVRARPKS